MVIIARDQVREPLYAIVPYFNPFRWRSRVKHTERALKHFSDAGAVIYLVEIGFNRRELVFANSGLDGSPASNCGVLGSDHNFRHKYIGLHIKDELWVKEPAINIGVQHLPYDWQQVAWLDADIQFVRTNFVGETIHKLQHGTTSDRAFLQMFSHARDVGPNYELLPEAYPHADGIGFIKAWQTGLLQTTITQEIKTEMQALGQAPDLIHPKLEPQETDDGSYYGLLGPRRVWPGLAWACTRKAWDAVGGLGEFAVWGGFDWHMSHCLIEKTNGMMRNDLHRNYKKLVMQWYHRCRTHIRRNVLVMEGTVLHHFHGRKAQRGYNTKHALLAKFGFDPLRHITRDSQGLPQLHDDRSTSYVQIRDMMRQIATERNEDVNEI